MTNKGRLHRLIAEDLEMEYKQNSKHQNFKVSHIDKLCKVLGLPPRGSKCKKKQRISDKLDLDFDQGYASVCRPFNQEELRKILKAVRKKKDKSMKSPQLYP